MMRYIVVFVLSFFIFGCSVKTLPPMQQYTLHLQKQQPKIPSSCTQKSVKILQPFSAKEYLSQELHYSVAQIEENIYNNASWSTPLYQNIYVELLKVIRDTHIFHTVLGYNSVGGSDYILEIEIEEFEQQFTQDLDDSFAKVEIVLSLVDKKSYQVVGQKHFSATIPAQTLDAKGGVVALNEAFNQIAQEIVVWLAGVCDA